ncbi:PEGA domain-containing protein, partial [Cuniculiplasma sp. SKW4]|uniref:PEGA domain-containing protein n=1 Tax=Cuniculiplasma sp. SKW4 TaxID=3400171 RepID=UPI003FD194B2
YHYTVSTADPQYIPNITSSSFTIDGNRISISVYFGVPYTVTFTETGLPSGTTWYVNITGHDSGAITGTSYSISLPNGTYTYTIATSDHEYVPVSYSGSVTVSGKSVSESITFSLVTYSVTFTETGLPSGTTWYVNITGHDSGAITETSYSISLPNGTYSYTIATSDHEYAPVSYSGSVTVSGNSVSESITFSLVTYTVTFTETGIESGQSWNVDINGVTHTVTGSSFTLLGNNGTSFRYSIMNSSSYYTTGVTSGEVIINGKDITVTLSFEHYSYIVGSFNQTNVNVTVNGKNFTVTSGKFMYKTTAGTYSVEISEKGYITVYKNFTLQAGQTVNISVNLKKEPVQNTDEIYYVLAGIIAVIVIASAVIVYLRKVK